ncbi:MAG: hypothetical protein Ct9H300mP1_20060 [Planctomycetaceae bacterium]|nr:MAG: hypothetical protein Ct9H300mP1_20060 [Planctomycetaceae bacterium]
MLNVSPCRPVHLSGDGNFGVRVSGTGRGISGLSLVAVLIVALLVFNAVKLLPRDFRAAQPAMTESEMNPQSQGDSKTHVPSSSSSIRLGSIWGPNCRARPRGCGHE